MKTLKFLTSYLILALFVPGLIFAADELTKSSLDAGDDKTTELVFNNAEIRDVLQLIADEFDLNIVMGDDVTGTLSVRLKGASLSNTLDALLLSRGYDYELRDNIIRVASAEVIKAEREQRLSKQEQEGLVSEVIVLSYLDAYDIEPTVRAMLTSRGSVSVLARRAYRGFQFGSQTSGGGQGGGASSSSSGGGGGGASALSSALGGSGSSGSSSGGSSGGGGLVGGRGDESPRSNTLMVTDVRGQVDKIKAMIASVDISPRQILIDAIVLEVDNDSLEDLGFDVTNTNSLATRGKTNTLILDANSAESNSDINSGIFSNDFPTSTDAGIHAFFQRLNGEDFELILHALLQNERTKTLSSPRILTIENQEATILVGEQFPIFEANVTDQGTTTETLSYYQPVGVSLQVIAQVTPAEEISMILHPSVTSVGAFVVGTTGLRQPRINIREADTRVLVQNGETLAIGGLLEDIEDEKFFRVPFLNRLPFLGNFFTRRQVDIDQRNLLIFITPRLMPKDSRSLSETEKIALQGVRDAGNYGFLKDRRQAVYDAYKQAKRTYENGKSEEAKALFLKVLTLSPNHEGAKRHLRELNALPEHKPIG